MEADEAAKLREALQPTFGRPSSRKSSSRGTDEQRPSTGFGNLEIFEEQSDEDLSTIASKGFSVDSFKKAPILAQHSFSLPEEYPVPEDSPKDETPAPPTPEPEPEPDPPSVEVTEEPETDDDSEFDLTPAPPRKPSPVQLEPLPSKSEDEEEKPADEEISVWSEDEEEDQPPKKDKSPRIPFIPSGIDNESSLMGWTDPTYATIPPKFWRFKSHARAAMAEGTTLKTSLAYADDVKYDPLKVGGYAHGSGVDIPDSARSSIVDPEDNIEQLIKKKGPLGDLSHLYQTSDLTELKKLPHVYLVESVDWETYFGQQEAALKTHDEKKNEVTMTEEEKALRERKSLLKSKTAPEESGAPSGASSRPSSRSELSPFKSQRVLPLYPDKVVEGKLKPNVYAYYFIAVDDPDTSLHFRLKSVQGDADMFISIDCLPSRMHHLWKTISITSEKSIDIYPHHKESKVGKYVVAVYSRAHKARFKLVVQKQLGEVDESEHMASTRKIVRRLSLLSKYKVTSLLQDFESASAEVEHKVDNEVKKEQPLSVHQFKTQEELWSDTASAQKYAGLKADDGMIRLEHPDAELYQHEPPKKPSTSFDVKTTVGVYAMDEEVQNIDDSMLKWRPFFKEEMDYANTSKKFNSMKELHPSPSDSRGQQQTQKQRNTKNLSFLNITPSPVQYSLSRKSMKETPKTAHKVEISHQKKRSNATNRGKGSSSHLSLSPNTAVPSLPSIETSSKKKK